MRGRSQWIAGFAAAVVAVVGVAASAKPGGEAQKKAAPAPAHQVPTSADGDVVVALCDGETTVEVNGVKPGEVLPRDQAQKVADELMRSWRQKNPEATWEDRPLLAQTADPKNQGHLPNSAAGLKLRNSPPAAPPGQPGGTTGDTGAKQMPAAAKANVQDGHTYKAFSRRDEEIWRASTQAFVDEGNKIFHDAGRMGGTVSISCDMCHPDSANTHPETYPKFQVQLGRVALLRDMINWCIENPVRGKPLADDDVRLRALEAYIYAQRRGVPLEYGKH